MSRSFHEFFHAELEPLLQSPDNFGEAVECLQNAMPDMATATDRSHVYQWLGTVHLSLASEALAHSLVHEARRHFEYVEEYQGKSIEEAPGRVEPRLNLARYYLTFGSEPESALEVLTLPEGASATHDEKLAMIFEHQMLSLRGVALTLLGREQEAAEALDAAFSERFAGKIPPRAVDVPSIMYLATRGVKFTRESAEGILAQLKKLGLTDDDLPPDFINELVG